MDDAEGAVSMAISRADIRIIYLCFRILDGALPYEEEMEEIMDKCKEILTSDEILEIDEEADSLLSGSESLRALAEKILNI